LMARRSLRTGSADHLLSLDLGWLQDFEHVVSVEVSYDQMSLLITSPDGGAPIEVSHHKLGSGITVGHTCWQEVDDPSDSRAVLKIVNCVVREGLTERCARVDRGRLFGGNKYLMEYWFGGDPQHPCGLSSLGSIRATCTIPFRIRTT